MSDTRAPFVASEVVAIAFDLLFAVVLLGVAAFLAATGVEARLDPNSPHGGAFQTGGALAFGVPGLLFALAAAFVWRRWTGRWIIQALPIVAALTVALYLVGVA